jgi:hypothetical protein
MRMRAALSAVLCLGIVSMSGPVASAAAGSSTAASSASARPATATATTASTASCDTSDLAMSTPSSAEETTVYATGTRAIDPVTLRNTSSVDCPDSGFIVLLLPNPVSEPEPTLEWRVGGGSWHGTSLSWDDGVVNGNASCASPCWKAGIVTLDVPPHTTYTIDLAVIFHSGRSSGFFSGAVYYTGQAVIPDGASGALVAWAYLDQAASSGSGGSGSGGGAPAHSSSPVVSSRSAAPARSTAPSPKASKKTSPKASASPSASAAATTSAASSPSAAVSAATPSIAPVADVRSGGSGISTLVTLAALAILASGAGTGLVLARRRRGKLPQSRA